MVRIRLIISCVLFASSVIGWPVSSLTLAKKEPQFVLGLSFLALAYESFNSMQIAWDQYKELKDA